MEKIAILLSGGVDSSVALKLLKKNKKKLTAFYLKIWLEDELSYLGQCPWEEDLKYVKSICEEEKITLKIIPFQEEYKNAIVRYTIEEIKSGRTPNPDILCNQRIKFGAFLDKIGKNFDKIATGHYAQIEKKKESFFLKKSPDTIKDQTYFLSQLNQRQLEKAEFPIGHLTKTKVRRLAEKYRLPNKNRKDSQGICFLGKIKFKEFIKHHFGEQTGNIIEIESKDTMGTHNGYWYYTIGQRQGLGLPGGPWYVVSKDIKKNIIYVSKNYYSLDKQRNLFEVSNLNWISTPNNNHLKVKLRHGEKFYNCKISEAKNKILVKLNERDQGIAPGQFAVFYDKEYCLGGGIISKAL